VQITDQLSFWGNAVAFVAVTGKTAFDLVINPRLFERQHKRATADPQKELEAARLKRRRSDLSTAITFAILAVSTALLMLALIK
jgi:hypothetical protein